MTRREQMTAHAAGPCAACHSQTDPIGFAFENFNAVGEFVTTDNGAPVDPSGHMRIDDRDVTFANAVDLVGAIGASAQFRACYARKWLRYALARREGDADESAARALAAALDRDHDVRGLLQSLAMSRSFMYRQVMPGEVTP
jgi:hypothetical protein